MDVEVSRLTTTVVDGMTTVTLAVRLSDP